MTVDTVETLARVLRGELHGDGSVEIRGVGDLRAAGPDQICFVRSSKYADLAARSEAGALIVGELLEVDKPQILVPDAQVGFAEVALHFHPLPVATEHSIHPTAVVDPKAKLAEPVQIGPGVTVDAGAVVGAGTILNARVTVGRGARIGTACVLHPGVVVYPGMRLGDRVVVHAGTVIGSDGFGYAQDRRPETKGQWIKVPQVGGVAIDDDVEIGANCTIDRGTMGDTRIGAGSKIDNVVHIGHNCVLGKHNALAGFCALSGSTVLGDRVSLAGHVVSGGHLEVCDDVRIGGNSVLLDDITESGDYMGYPLQKIQTWGRTFHTLGHLLDLRKRVRDLGAANRPEG